MAVDICRTVARVSPEPSAPDLRQAALQPRVDRRFPTRLVRISGKNLDDEFLSDNIKSVTVEETARGLSKAEVVLLNSDMKLTDNPLFQSNVKVEIYTGYRSKPFVKRGTFFCVKPIFSFKKGSQVVELECYGEEWPLMVDERRDVYENKRDSDIATDIATRYGLTADVDFTNPLHEHVAQMNVTDAVFLESRSQLYGYDFYVEEGVLHFHAPRFVDSNLSLFYGSDQVSTIASFEVSADPWMKGMKWTKTGIDRLTGQEWNASSLDEPDIVSKTIGSRNKSKFQRASALATFKGVRPQRFIVGEGQEQTEAEARANVRGYTQATEWITHGSATVIGVETLKARQLVELVGIGHHAGFYYVTHVRHSIKQGYTMQFKAVRPGIGALSIVPGALVGTGTGRLTPDDASNQSATVGTAQVRG